jgi:hypothetical protein
MGGYQPKPPGHPGMRPVNPPQGGTGAVGWCPNMNQSVLDGFTVSS